MRKLRLDWISYLFKSMKKPVGEPEIESSQYSFPDPHGTSVK
jgi:hypothetical protein